MNIIGVRPEIPAQVKAPRRYSWHMALATTSASGSVREELAAATKFLAEFASGTAKQRARRLPRAPWTAMQTAALRDPDPFARRSYLHFLDHYANDRSMEVFMAGLGDPVDFVRTMALHGLACESCKAGGLCVAEVVPALIAVFEADPSPEVRSKALPLLLRLGGRDDRAWAALGRAAAGDPDPVIRQAAGDAITGRYVAPRKRYERRQRQHAKTARRRGSSSH
jgi:hypothetical protein